ncbi:hypothetical protein C8J36_104248 [Rhizobium sp. PP-F2F-G48]|uniref:AGROH133_08824 family phage infection protein n=1 Tax=Rhizobium sp. PP-F2F-G48 TaxID=2135651 RepID=UPI001045B7A0|nr:DUF4345 domain-containing protein [Rhizobium sp. PP-F2F-G48]TCM55055.1 hypothetical protein C8J36_104248 [Rhizobium sp. PP-F2F-G48]
MDLYIPTETGEFLAFLSAVATCVMGLFFLFAPGLSFRAMGLALKDGRRGGYAEARSTLGGFPLGLGLAAIVLAQPMVYLALGSAFALAAFGRILSMLSDQGNTVVNWLLVLVQMVLAILPLAYVFGFL